MKYLALVIVLLISLLYVEGSLLVDEVYDSYLDVLNFDQSILYLGESIENDKNFKTLSKWSWNDCGNDDDALKLLKLKVNPDPPKSGKNLTINAIGLVNEYIDNGAYADVTIKLGYITLYNTRYDLCKEAHDANAQIQCPVEKGIHTLIQDIELPSHIPPAAYTLQVRANTNNDQPLACLNFRLSFLPFLSVFD